MFSLMAMGWGTLTPTSSALLRFLNSFFVQATTTALFVPLMFPNLGSLEEIVLHRLEVAGIDPVNLDGEVGPVLALGTEDVRLLSGADRPP
jgi:hypothetical protein